MDIFYLEQILVFIYCFFHFFDLCDIYYCEFSLKNRNNQIDMYEEYFDEEDAEYNVQKMEIKTMKLFKDNNKGIKRAVNNLSWHPDGPERIAASYCIMRFQQQQADMKLDSFIWDVHNPNMPLYSICPPSPIGKKKKFPSNSKCPWPSITKTSSNWASDHTTELSAFGTSE